MTQAIRLYAGEIIGFQVYWAVKGRSQHGNGHPIARETAEAAVKSANRNYPNIHHWVEPVFKNLEG